MRMNLIGQVFHQLTVVARLDTTPSGARWLCVCECGNTCTKITTQLRRKTRKAGGCPDCEQASRSIAMTVHGDCRQNTVGTERLYSIWKGLTKRCREEGNPYYGGKGVAVCAEWRSYPAFREWALANGYRDIPDVTRGDRLSIERINPAVGYCPENCEWITGRENSRRMATRDKAGA
jgi:hypothetical protein